MVNDSSLSILYATHIQIHVEEGVIFNLKKYISKKNAILTKK